MKIIVFSVIFLLFYSVTYIELKAYAQGELPIKSTGVLVDKDKSNSSNSIHTNQSHSTIFDKIRQVFKYLIDSSSSSSTNNTFTTPENVTHDERNMISTPAGINNGNIGTNNTSTIKENTLSNRNESLQQSPDRSLQINNTITSNSQNLSHSQSLTKEQNTVTSASEQQSQSQLPIQPVQNQNVTENQVQIPTHGNSNSFKASGTINSDILTVSSKWHATGEWNMIVENGKMKIFTTNMSWFNGTSGHTHEFLNFESKGKIHLPSDNILTINGKMDVATNGKISWNHVNSAIDIGGGGRTITISLDHNKTNHHFAGQPITGTVKLLIPCSNKPGPSMEILPECN